MDHHQIKSHQLWLTARALWIGIVMALVVLRAMSSFAEPAPDQLPAAPIVELKRVMGERLAVMHDVARYKWTHGLAIEDLERERTVLVRTVERAVAGGVEPALAERMVRAQIAAAKHVQRADFAAWETAGAGPFEPVPDLATELRPRITRLTDALIASVRAAAPLLDDCAAREALAAPPPGADAAVWQIAVAGVVVTASPCRRRNSTTR